MNELATVGTELRGDLAPDQRRRITAVRVIVDVATTPGEPFSIRGIAQRCALAEATVREVLDSEEFQQLVDERLKARVSACLAKYLQRAEQVLDDDQVGRSGWNETGRTLVSVKKAIEYNRASKSEPDNLATAMALLDGMAKANKLKRAKVEVVDARD